MTTTNSSTPTNVGVLWRMCRYLLPILNIAKTYVGLMANSMTLDQDHTLEQAIQLMKALLMNAFVNYAIMIQALYDPSRSLFLYIFKGVKPFSTKFSCFC